MSLWFCYPDETWRALYVALLADKPEGIDSLTADEIVALCAYLETSDALASVEPYGVDFR